MAFWIWVGLSIYWLGFVVTVLMSRVSTRLLLLRALVWPIWWLFGWPPGASIRLPRKKTRR